MKEMFGSTIRTQREALMPTAKAAAQAMGLDPSHLSRLENAEFKETPAADVMGAIERVLGIPQYRLLQALGYDVGPAPEGPQVEVSNPALDGLIARLRQIELTNERFVHLDYVLDLYLREDRAAANRGEEPPGVVQPTRTTR